MNQLQSKLASALKQREEDLSIYTWKGPKVEKNGVRVQEVIKLMDATPEQLEGFYRHCQSMLYSTDKDNPGRLVLLNIIKDQRERCNTELYLRWLENAYLTSDRQKIQRFTYLNAIRAYMDNNKELFPQDRLGDILITSVTTGIPDDFTSLTIDYVLDGLVDRLGSFNKKHVTLNFITKMGLWFTPQENREFSEEAKATGKSPIDIVKERCGLRPNTSIRTTPKGLLNFKEFRAIISLRNKKYSEMTTDQLLTLRNKVLFALEDEVNFHASTWIEREQILKKIADARGIELNID